MLIFMNKKSGTHFIVRNTKNKVEQISNSDHRTLSNYADITGGVEYLVLPDLKAIHQFRAFVKTGILQNIPYNETKEYLLNTYPEYFI